MNTKYFAVVLMALISLAVTHSQAQVGGFSRPVNTKDADALLKSYVGIAGGQGAAEKAEFLAAQPPAVTAENVKLIRGSLARKISDDERVMLLRLMGKMYTRNNASGQNAEIIKDLKTHLVAGNRNVARAATFSLSRMGSDEDLIPILKQAKTAAVLNNDEFAGELGHSLPWFPKERQREALALIEASNSQYGNEVTVMYLKNAALIDKFAPETQSALEQFLRRGEPHFPRQYDFYAVSTSLRYADWLHAWALVSSKIGRSSYIDVVLGALNDKRIDPRKILAYLSAREGRELMASSGKRAQFTPLVERAGQYARSLPGNRAANDIAKDLAAYFATLK